ncbi:MAG: metallophosphoesterase [Phycisphaerales bacterium]|nr:metallophosphoesterase [Phycisphaerales bacterium]
MPACLFTSDLHGHVDRYEKLFRIIESERPGAVFLGGDLLPSGFGAVQSAMPEHEDFISDYLVTHFRRLRTKLSDRYPEVFLILGNDDPRFEEAAVLDIASHGLWHYVHDRKLPLAQHAVYGYAFVPPTPFQLKDWERYDVSRYVDPGCISPEEGFRSVPATEHEVRYTTIEKDLARLTGDDAMDGAVMLFHTPPYQTNLDRAALDGKMIDHAPLDVHVGSIAVRRFIEARQPMVTLHGHIHESARLTGSWRDRIGRTEMFSGAHDGPELALVRFDLDDPSGATRELL